MRHGEELTFAELYGISAEEYKYMPTTSLPFSVRIINRLMSNGITTAADLFKATPIQLMKIKGFGRNCLDAINEYCITFLSVEQQIKNAAKESVEDKDWVKPYIKQIKCGDFSFLEQSDWTENEASYVNDLKEAYDVLGQDTVLICISSRERVQPIVDMLMSFQKETKPYQEIKEMLYRLPVHRRDKKVLGYIRAFTISDEERIILQSFCSSDSTTVSEFSNIVAVADESQDRLLAKRFLQWCNFDLSEEIRQLLKKVYANERDHIVIKLRSEGQTLEQTGGTLGVTRERVRQIELKVKRTFARLHSRIRIVSKVAAERNGKTILSPTEIACYCENAPLELLYLLQSYEGTNYTYDKQLDVFVVGDDSLHDRIDAYLERLPDVVAIELFEQLALTAEEDESIPKEMFEKTFFESYRQTGTVYHRTKLSLGTIYQDILNKYFPEGMHIYDHKELERFRAFVLADYGNIRLPENDRALTARISGIGVLCGRGMYRAKKQRYIPKELLERIYKFIANNESQVLLMGTVFKEFEEELSVSGVNNRYYLQGILHETYADKLVIKRDYIFKDASITSFYTAIVNFIRKSKHPVSKQRIHNEFPGITDIVITLAVGDSEILNFYGEYLHSDCLLVTDDEKRYLYNTVSQIVSDDMPHHVKDIYEIINGVKPEVLTRNSILFSFGAYSILEYLFREDFQFLRPYIARFGVEIGRPGERLRELIYSTDMIPIADIRDFAKENRLQIQSMIDYANSCNDEFLLTDRDTLMRISKIGVSEETAKIIEDCVAQTVTQTMPIYELQTWSLLPKLNVPWTDWLLFSILKKWGSRLSVGTSSNQMKMAVPLVAPLGKLDITEFSAMSGVDGTASIKLDNLDNIDELLEAIIDEDIWEEQYEF